MGAAFIGVIPLNSPLFTSLPILGLILGIALGVWAPFGAGKASSPQPARADESVILANHLR